MRFDVDCRPGELASKPEEALGGLLDLAVSDGADRSEWLEKALISGGATELSVEVSNEPRYQIVTDATKEAVAVYDRVTLLMREAIRERLHQAARDADIDRYRRVVKVEE